MKNILVFIFIFISFAVKGQELWQLSPWAVDSNYVLGALASGEPYWIHKDSLGISGGGGGDVSGSGAANKVAYWQSSDTITYDTAFHWVPASKILGIGTTSPVGLGSSLHVHGGTFSTVNLTNSTTGQAGTDGSRIYTVGDSLYIANRENARIDIGTNNATRMTITGAGRVGINNNNPLTTLDIGGEVTISSLDSDGSAPATSGTTVKVVSDANGKLSFQTNNTGTVTSVGLTLGTSGTDANVIGSPVTGSGSFTLNLPTGSSTNRGLISSTDWTTFNNKFTLPALTSGSVLFSNGTTISQNNSNFFWNNSQEQLGIGTATPNTYILDGYNGIGIYDASSARIGMGNSSRNWIQYLSGTEFRIWNNNSGESFAIRSSDGKWQGGTYISSGTNKAAYFDVNGVLQRGDFDVLDGVGIAGYVARWFDANTQNTGGLYFPSEAGNQMSLGTTAPSTYLQNGTSKGFAIHDANGDPRLSMSNPTRAWVWYMSGNDLNLWNSSSAELLRLDDAGRVGILNTSPQRTLHVTGEMRVTDLTTDTPTRIVGADADGDLTSIYTGTGLLLSGNTLSVNGVGTVTSIATTNGITGGTITTTGTVQLTGQASALHNLATNGIIARTGAGTVAGRTITAGDGISVTNGDGVSGNPTISTSQIIGTLYRSTTLGTFNTSTTPAKIDFNQAGFATNVTASTANDEITSTLTNSQVSHGHCTCQIVANGTGTYYAGMYLNGTLLGGQRQRFDVTTGDYITFTLSEYFVFTNGHVIDVRIESDASYTNNTIRHCQLSVSKL